MPDTTKLVWPAERIALMVFLLKQGTSTPETARLLGVTKNAVIGKCQRIGTPVNVLRGIAPVAPVEEVAMIKPVLSPDPCTIEYLTEHRCHWPLWKQHTDERLYCGSPVHEKTYCLTHWKKAHTTYARMKLEPRESLRTTKVSTKLPKSMVL